MSPNCMSPNYTGTRHHDCYQQDGYVTAVHISLKVNVYVLRYQIISFEEFQADLMHFKLYRIDLIYTTEQ